MRTEAGGIFLIVLGLILIMFLTTDKGRFIWQTLTGRYNVIEQDGVYKIVKSGSTGTTKGW
jgi:hypothetical protein